MHPYPGYDPYAAYRPAADPYAAYQPIHIAPSPAGYVETTTYYSSPSLYSGGSPALHHSGGGTYSTVAPPTHYPSPSGYTAAPASTAPTTALEALASLTNSGTYEQDYPPGPVSARPASPPRQAPPRPASSRPMSPVLSPPAAAQQSSLRPVSPTARPVSPLAQPTARPISPRPQPTPPTVRPVSPRPQPTPPTARPMSQPIPATSAYSISPVPSSTYSISPLPPSSTRPISPRPQPTPPTSARPVSPPRLPPRAQPASSGPPPRPNRDTKPPVSSASSSAVSSSLLRSAGTSGSQSEPAVRPPPRLHVSSPVESSGGLALASAQDMAAARSNTGQPSVYQLVFKLEPYGTMSEKSPTGLRVVHFIAYRLSVINAAEPDRSFYVIKRFSQIWDLKHAVKKALSRGDYAALHPFPPKKWHQGDTPAVIQERCTQIALWFNSLNRAPAVFSVPAMRFFLDHSGVDDANAEPPPALGQPSSTERRALLRQSSPSSSSSPSLSSEQPLHTTAASLVGHPFALLVSCERAHDLRAIRSGAAYSNPYCFVTLLSSPCAASPLTAAGDFLLARTPIHNATVHPVWHFPVFVPALSLLPSAAPASPLLRVDVWDHAVEDSFLGQAFVSVAHLANCRDDVDQLCLPLQARPPVPMGAGRPPRIDLVSGSVTLSLRFGQAQPVAAVPPSKTRKGLREKLRAHRAQASFCAFAAPPQFLPTTAGFAANFTAPSATSSSTTAAAYATDAGSYLFSFKICFHCASNLKEEKDPRPYLHLYLVSASSTERTLLFRTTVVDNSLNPVWEAAMVSPCLRSTDRLEWEIRSWTLGVSSSDTLFGFGSMSFPQQGPIAPQSRISVPLGPMAGSHDRVSGSLCISYQTAQPVLDRNTVVHDMFPGDEEAENYPAIPNYASHCINYGVSIPNFRDIGGWPVTFQRNGVTVRGRMRPRMVFRTSGISRATENDAWLLVHELGVKSLIDLRTPDYAGNRGPFLCHLFDVLQLQINKKNPKDFTVYAESAQEITLWARDAQDTIIVSRAQQSSTASEQDSALAALESVPFDFLAESLRSAKSREDWGHLYLCSLVGKTFQFAMIKKSGKGKLLTAGLLAKTPQEQRRIICGPIFDRCDGLVVLYRMMLENCKLEFLQLFTLFDQIVCYPVAFFCNHGKDRTGLTAMFLQAICGVDRDTIVDNYRLSDHFLRPLKFVVDYEMTDGGLSPEIMSRTPGFVMQATLDYLDRKYGGPVNYLINIGVPLPSIDAIRDRLVEVC